MHAYWFSYKNYSQNSPQAPRANLIKIKSQDRLKLINKINMDLPVGQHIDGEEGTQKQSPSQSLKLS